MWRSFSLIVMSLKTNKSKQPAVAAAAAAAAEEQLSDEFVHSDDEEQEGLPDVLALRNAFTNSSLLEAFERLMQTGIYKQEGATGVATKLFQAVLHKMILRVLSEKRQPADVTAKFGDLSLFLAECDRLGVVAETAQFETARGPDLARRLGHVKVTCVPREDNARATTLFSKVRETLERLSHEPGDNAARGHLVLLAPDIWTDNELDIIACGAPAPPRVCAQEIGTMSPTELPGDIRLKVTETFVQLQLPVPDPEAKDAKRKSKPPISISLSNEKTRLILEQLSRLTAMQDALELAATRLEAVSPDEQPLADRARAADSTAPMLDMLVANDAFLLLIFLAVFVTAAPLVHKTDGSDAKNQFISFASLALHCTPPQLNNIIHAVKKLAPQLICGDAVKSDFFDAPDSLPALQLAFSTVAFYLALQQVSTCFREIAVNTPHLQRLLPLALLAKLPINAMEVSGTADQPTKLLPHPDFKALGPGIVTIADLLFFAFATRDEYPAALVFALRRMLPWQASEMMFPRNIDPRLIIGLNDETFAHDVPLAIAAFSGWFFMLALPPFYRNKPSSDSPIRKLVRAHREDQTGLFVGTSSVFERICRQPVSIDPLFFVSHAAALQTADDRSSAYSKALLCDFVAKHVDHTGNLVHMKWEDDKAAPRRRGRAAAAAADDDDDDDDGRMTVKTSATARTAKRTRAADDDDDDDERPPKRARAADDGGDDEATPSETEKMIERMIQKSLAKFSAKQN